MPRYQPFPGRFRRLIGLKTWDDRTVVGWIEDDYHHFGITLSHDGSIVTDIRAKAARYPWTPCRAAGDLLRDLIGQPLLERCTAIGKQLEMRRQCTHLFDLAGLLSAHAFHRRCHRRYHAIVEALLGDEAKAGWMTARLLEDERPVMAWEYCGGIIQDPPALAGRSVERGFREWIETLDEREAERASVLRRTLFVATAREATKRITQPPDPRTTPDVCHTYQFATRIHAVRDEGDLSAWIKYDTGPEGMLALVDTKP